MHILGQEVVRGDDASGDERSHHGVKRHEAEVGMFLWPPS